MRIALSYTPFLKPGFAGMTTLPTIARQQYGFSEGVGHPVCA